MSLLLLGETESVCPVCLKRLPAQRVADGDTVFLKKCCSEHGEFIVPVWRGLASYRRWGQGPRNFATPTVSATPLVRGCPHDCGLCPDHCQQSCCVLLEVTSRCNLECPICFASAGRAGRDATEAEIAGWLDTLEAAGGHVHIQLSGGEPTLRDDLPDIVRQVRARGFNFIQVNTNGIRLAREPDYLVALAEAGLDCVFLQFDGITDDVHQALRGAKLQRLKERAIAGCSQAGVGVVLVPTVMSGVNAARIGEIVAFAKAHLPTVRAVHFQPMSYFGRAPAPVERVTLPEIIRALVAGEEGAIGFDDFMPGSAENPYCSFSGRFRLGIDGKLHPQRGAASSCCGTPISAPDTRECCGTPRPSPDIDRARRYVAGQWRAAGAGRHAGQQVAGLEAFDAFLAAREQTLGLSGMAFQDAWTLDLDRLRQCHIHIAASEGRLIPFCAFNLTTSDGRALYRGAA